MTSGTSISQLETLGAAHLNFVIRREGEAAAKYLQERFGTPYLMARPYGIQGTLDWLENGAALWGRPADKAFIRKEKENALEQTAPIQAVLGRFLRVHRNENRLILAGHADVVQGIGEYGKEWFGFTKADCYCDCLIWQALIWLIWMMLPKRGLLAIQGASLWAAASCCVWLKGTRACRLQRLMTSGGIPMNLPLRDSGGQ